MILYFSGTGNSKFVAEKIAVETGDEIIDIKSKLKTNSQSELVSNEKLVIVTPTYAWRIPKIVNEYLLKTKITGAKKVWFVMTCGGSNGNAYKYNKLLSEKLSLSYMGTEKIVMPENYIAMFNVPNKAESIKIVQKEINHIENAGEIIKSNKPFVKSKISFGEKFSSNCINPIFYQLFVRAKKFEVKESCISCGKCEKACPLNNVHLVNGKPTWENTCTHCMACICHCPVDAIEYGKKTKNQYRYNFESLGIK